MKGKREKGRRVRVWRPDLHQERAGRHLLVWGGLGQWLAVDDELWSLLRALDGRRPLKVVLRRHAQRWRKPPATVQREASEALGELERRGIIDSGGPRDAVPPEPLSLANVTVNLTNRCNLKCSFCYNASRLTDEMPIDALMEGIASGGELLEEDATFIILGGEPLLDLQRLLTALDRAGEIFGPPPQVSTNGTRLTDEAVAALTERRVEVQVSLDSHDPEVHDAFRGCGVHAKAVAGVERLVAAGAYTILSKVYDAQTFRDLEPYLEMAHSLGVDEARLIPMRMIGGGLQARQKAPDQLEVLEHMLEVLERRPELRHLLGRDFFSIITSICRTSAQRTSCGIGRRVVFIDADGKVYPCPNHIGPDHICGDLHQRALAEIMRSSPVMSAVRDRYQVSRYTRCRGCAFRHWCAGDCRGEVLALEGDPAAPSPHCDELREVYPRILWLLADGDLRLTPSASTESVREPIKEFL